MDRDNAGKGKYGGGGDDVKAKGKSRGSRGLLCKRKAKLRAMQLANWPEGFADAKQGEDAYEACDVDQGLASGPRKDMHGRVMTPRRKKIRMRDYRVDGRAPGWLRKGRSRGQSMLRAGGGEEAIVVGKEAATAWREEENLRLREEKGLDVGEEQREFYEERWMMGMRMGTVQGTCLCWRMDVDRWRIRDKASKRERCFGAANKRRQADEAMPRRPSY